MTVTKLQIVKNPQQKDGVNFFTLNVSFDNKSSVFFETRYSELYALHKVLCQLNKKETLPSFPGKNLFSTMTSEVLEKRKDEINTYLELLLKVNGLGGVATILEFVNSKGKSISEIYSTFSFQNRVECFNFFQKKSKIFANTFNSQAYQLTYKDKAFILKKYGIHSQDRVNSWRQKCIQFSNFILALPNLQKQKNLAYPIQIFVNSDLKAKCKCSRKQYFSKIWTITNAFESTLQAEIKMNSKEKQFPSQKAVLNLLRQIFTGLKYLYDHNFYHGNIKPQNIGLIKSSSSDHVTYVLMDFCDIMMSQKENEMAIDIEKNPYSLNLAYKPTLRMEQIKLFQCKDFEERNFQDIRDDDMYALGITLVRYCCNLQNDDLQGFQNSELRDDFLQNSLQRVSEQYKNVYQYLMVLLKIHPPESNLTIFDEIYPLLFPGVISQQEEEAKKAMQKIANQIDSSNANNTTTTSSDQIENDSKFQIEPLLKKLPFEPYSDICLILKNEEEKKIQKQTQKYLRILLSDQNVTDNQFESLVASISSTTQFEGLVVINLSQNPISDLSSFPLSKLLSGIHSIDSLSLDLRDIPQITSTFILNTLESVKSNPNIISIILDISQNKQFDFDSLINIIDFIGYQSDYVLQFSFYVFESKIEVEKLTSIEDYIQEKILKLRKNLKINFKFSI